jgi:hypothetical protein
MTQPEGEHVMGIDYGNGKTNIDTATGIRFGVISMHDICQAWSDSAEGDYGKPTCGECGNEMRESNIENEGEEKDYYCEILMKMTVIR